MPDLHSVENLHLSAAPLGVAIYISVPRSVRALLDLILSGWVFKKASPPIDPDIAITWDGRYALLSPLYAAERPHRDIIAIINEFIVALGYAIAHQRPDLQLIHGAGFALAGRTTVLFGARKTGKSTFVGRMAAQGATVFADDILLWSPKEALFYAVGASPRLRRPVPDDIVAGLDPRAFIAGQNTCYLNSGRVSVAAAGQALMPDRYIALRADHTQKTIRFWAIVKQIAANRIA
ncbi:hypothetical protein AN189_01290 [Loktanella sp. 3ANDIMAR09]|uniref:hypothetical protein n=1 Tax=Loktanella sp. 3ANDIMAR09 TaxID=1225657 RepID=UPI000700635B|nr:hypothetical protein [Loktanella sp. 3ANDIMAR09]KQI70062.1 hypothetical protein AN189_01290 [Loktanella sp. 3ANDIMAR09]